jgi:hypothetical protein
MLIINLIGCKPVGRDYSIQDQHTLAERRIESMKGQLDFKITLEKKTIHFHEEILFTANFTNRTGIPLMLRVPKQSDILDIRVPKIALLYSIIPLDKSVSLETPYAILNSMPFMSGSALQSDEFEMLDPNVTKEVKLELPNSVYLKQADQWVETELPPGQYWIKITYENQYIGFQIVKPDQIYYRDVSAWVGRIDAEPVLLTVQQ